MISFMSVFPPYRGGISNFSDYLFTHLSKTREVEAFNFKQLYPKVLFPGKTQFLENPNTEYNRRVLHSYNPWNWKTTANKVAVLKPEVLLFSFWHPFFIPAFNGIISQVKKISPETTICTVAHNVSPHEGFPFSRRLMRSFFKKNDLIVVLSDQTQQEFDRIEVSTPNVKLFHPVYSRPFPTASKEELKRKYGIQQNEQIPLFFGLIRDYKGLDILIKALNRMDLKKNNIRPFIVGEFYTDKQKFLDLIKPEDKERYVIIDRFVSQEEADEIFTMADLLTLPYKSASQSGVFNDALNFHLPAVVSNHPGLTEHISHKETGLIFESEQIDELKQQLSNFFSEPSFKDQIASNLPKLKNRLSWTTFTEELDQSLQNIQQNDLP